MKIFTFMVFFFISQTSLDKYLKIGLLNECVTQTFKNYLFLINLPFIILGKGKNIVFMNMLC